jgi:hypothetical protein
LKLKHYILFALLIGLFTTCKKFPEDPFISLNTVQDRLKGTWKFVSIMHEGNEIISIYNDSIQPASISDLQIHFSFGRKSTTTGNPIVNDFSIYSGYLSMYFEIKKKKIFFKNNVGGFFNKLFSSSEYFDIQKLYNGTLKIKNDNYEIILKKINNK